jgi:hypothetical protein
MRDIGKQRTRTGGYMTLSWVIVTYYRKKGRKNQDLAFVSTFKN